MNGPHPALADHPWRHIDDTVEVDVHRGKHAFVIVTFPNGSTDPADATVVVGNTDRLIASTVEDLRAFGEELVVAADLADLWWARLLNGA